MLCRCMTSPQLLLKKWITERSKDGYYMTSRAVRRGTYSEVMMIKKGTPHTQQAFMVRMQSTIRHLINTNAMPGLDSDVVSRLLTSPLKHLCLRAVPRASICLSKPELHLRHWLLTVVDFPVMLSTIGA